VSCVSGYTGASGEYALPLPPGDYQLIVESVPEGDDLPEGMLPFASTSDIGPQLVGNGSPSAYLPHYPNVPTHTPRIVSNSGSNESGLLQDLKAGELRSVTLQLRQVTRR
jgi:hypothetical protein